MNKDFFIHNRQALLKATPADVLVFAGNISVQRSNDASYDFEQEANFWYLTGIDAPGWQVVIQKERTVLIAPDVDEMHRIFDGSLSDEIAKEQSGVDEVVSHRAGETLVACLKDKKVASLGEDPHQGHYDFALNPGPVELLKKLKDIPGTIEDCRRELATLRAIKQPEEIALIRRAIAVTVEGFEKVKKNIDNYKTEYEIEADFTHYFRNKGAKGHAYDPIVASGKNACTLHYIENQSQLTSGELVLLDIGARNKGYAADITRTYAYGEVSERHRAVYHAVEGAQRQIIALLQSGLSIKEYFGAVDMIMQTALKDLGLLKEEGDYRTYFPHSISHGLGIDVHDSLGGPEVFQVGMVLTVEPGIYIPEEGIGVRIEDDILITEDGHENLSAALSTSL